MNQERRQSDIELALLRAEMAEMKIYLSRLEERIDGLLEAWRTATGLVKFMKWIAGAMAAIALIWLFIKDHIK